MDIVNKVIPVLIAGLFFGAGLPALYAFGLRLLAGRTEYTADGKLVEADQPTIESPKITMFSDIEYTIEFDYENVSYCFYVYNNALPIEDVPTFLAGIVWPEATNP